MRQTISNHRSLEMLIHVIGWGILFGFPFFFIERNGTGVINWIHYIRHSIIPLSFMVVFYVNYFNLIPFFLFKEKIRQYVIINIIMIICISLVIHIWQLMSAPSFPKEVTSAIDKIVKKGPPMWVFYTRDLLSLILTVGLSVAIRMSVRWTEAEAARREAEKSRAEAELKNLRNQINPHFLLNTLNNIYALIVFNSDKAQQAVQDLSKLLRYVLYDNQQKYVSLQKEIDFIQNYIELMKIRLTDNVKVETDFTLLPVSNAMIAPLIFISLIENAFKHGISPVESSFIKISITELENNKIICEIINSYHPKTETDKSGSGIGLEQVSKRLELLYPNRYIWHKGVSDNGKEYNSILVIQN